MFERDEIQINKNLKDLSFLNKNDLDQKYGKISSIIKSFHSGNLIEIYSSLLQTD